VFKLAAIPWALITATIGDGLSLSSYIVGGIASGAAILTLVLGVKYRVVADQQALTIENLEADRDTWKGMAERRAHDLELAHTEKQDILKAVSDLKEEKARLEALPNLSIIIEQMSKEAQRAEEASQKRVNTIVAGFADVMNSHEVAAVKRHGELIRALDRNNQKT
jgi:hypothetical protein